MMSISAKSGELFFSNSNAFAATPGLQDIVMAEFQDTGAHRDHHRFIVYQEDGCHGLCSTIGHFASGRALAMRKACWQILRSATQWRGAWGFWRWRCGT